MMQKLIFFLLIVSVGGADTPQIDSLKKILPSLSGREQFNVLYTLSDIYEGEFPQEALRFARKAIDVAKEYGITDSLAILHATASSSYCLLGDFAEAIKSAQQALDISTDSRKEEQIALAHSKFGIVYTYMGQYSKALFHHNEALKIRERLGVTVPAIRTLNNIGIVYHNIGMYDKAIEYYKEVMRRKSKTIDTLATIRLYHNIGFSEYKRGNLDSAQAYHTLAFALTKKIKFHGGLAYSYLNLGLVAHGKKQYRAAHSLLNESLQRYESLGQKHGALQALVALGTTDLALGNYRAAIRSLERAVDLAAKIKSPDQLAAAYEVLYKIYRKTGPLKKEFEFFRLYSIAKDSLLQVRESNKIAELTITLQETKSEQEILRLKAEKEIDAANLESQRIRSVMQFGGIAILSALLLLLYVHYRKIDRTKILLAQKNDELEHLNKQLQDRLHEIKTLSGLVPICAHCKKIRDDEGYWQQLEGYLSEHTSAKFSHGICPDCVPKFFPGISQSKKE